MRSASNLFVAFCVSFFLLSCGAKNSPEFENSKNPKLENAKLVLKMFAGYSCASCNEELPVMNSRLARELGKQIEFLDARVYVVAGPNWSKADQAVADRYGKELGLNQFDMYPDNKCKTEYVKYYAGTSCLVPATVLLRPNGQVIQVYEQGIINLDEFMSRVKELLNE
jgi:peroxiredoxin